MGAIRHWMQALMRESFWPLRFFFERRMLNTLRVTSVVLSSVIEYFVYMPETKIDLGDRLYSGAVDSSDNFPSSTVWSVIFHTWDLVRHFRVVSKSISKAQNKQNSHNAPSTWVPMQQMSKLMIAIFNLLKRWQNAPRTKGTVKMNDEMIKYKKVENKRARHS